MDSATCHQISGDATVLQRYECKGGTAIVQFVGDGGWVGSGGSRPVLVGTPCSGSSSRRPADWRCVNREQPPAHERTIAVPSGGFGQWSLSCNRPTRALEPETRHSGPQAPESWSGIVVRSGPSATSLLFERNTEMCATPRAGDVEGTDLCTSSRLPAISGGFRSFLEWNNGQNREFGCYKTSRRGFQWRI